MQTSKIRPNLLAVLEDGGHRVTAPRRTITYLLDKKEEGFTAEDICIDLPNIGRSTVYRTIKLLLEAGVVCKLTFPDGAPKYTLARIEHHHHIVCVRCGAVDEFRDMTIERLLRTIGKEIDGEIVGHRMEFYTVCLQCLPKSPT